MRVTEHAEKALLALGPNLPMPASVIVNRLRKTPAPDGTTAALEVATLQSLRGDLNPVLSSRNSNGDTVVVIVRSGAAITAMLRRSWNQPFTPEAFGVEAVVRWRWADGRWAA